MNGKSADADCHGGDFSVCNKVVDRPNPCRKFRNSHHTDVPTSINLTHPENPTLNAPFEAANTARYKHTPAAQSPFADARSEIAVKGIRKGYDSAKSDYKVNHADLTEQHRPIRKPVVKEARPEPHHTGKKPLRNANTETVSTYDPLKHRETLRSSTRYTSSKRFQEQGSPLEYRPASVRTVQLGVDQRYKHTPVVHETLPGVMKDNKDNCEDRSGSVSRPPWALDDRQWGTAP